MEFREGRVTSSYGRTTAAASVRPALTLSFYSRRMNRG